MYSKSSGVIDLLGKVCLVTGGSRGIGKGIAVQLAHHGATCYVTGRNMETLEALNKEVEGSGGSGKCIPIQCDHGNDDEIKKLFERIDKENNGKLDLLVNNAFSAVEFIADNIGKKFWELPPEAWDVVNKIGLRSHYICSNYAAKMMVKKRQGLIINLSSIGGLQYLFSVPYGIGKAAKDRMAQDCAVDLKEYKVAFISLWPGLTRTETFEKKARENPAMSRLKDNLDNAETPTFVGRTVAALLSEHHTEVMMKSGKIVLTVDIARAHGITDENGHVPPSMFQLNYFLRMGGYKNLAAYIPDFIRVPISFIRVATAYKTS